MKTLPQMAPWFTVYQRDFGESMTVTVINHALFNADYVPDLTLAVNAIPCGTFDDDQVKLLVTLLQKSDASPTLMPLMKRIFDRLTVTGRRRAYEADSRIVQREDDCGQMRRTDPLCCSIYHGSGCCQ
jgi:hypothetical protein